MNKTTLKSLQKLSWKIADINLKTNQIFYRFKVENITTPPPLLKKYIQD